MSASRELRLERLVGRRVRAGNNKVVGRIEEVVVERQGGRYLVTEYHLGAAGMWERMGHATLLFRAERPHGRAARFDQLDVSDPERPRLLCRFDELRKIESEPRAGEPEDAEEAERKTHIGRRPKGR